MDQPVSKSSKKASTSSLGRLKVSRRFLAIASAILVVAVLVGLGVYSQYAWGQYIDQSEVTYEKVRVSTRKELSSEVSEETIERLSINLADQAGSICGNLPILGGLRIRLSDSAYDHQEECQRRAELVSGVAAAARELSSYLSTEGEAALIYNDLHDHLSEAKPDGYKARQDAWRQARVELESLADTNTDYADQVISQLSLIDNVIIRYSDLIKADKDQKRPAFDAAVVKLQDAYDGLSDVSEDQKDFHNKTVEDFVMVVEKL